jgi:hypothetical protein
MQGTKDKQECDPIERSRWKMIGQHSTSQPPLLVPDQPFPPYAYGPGHTPHPTRDPGGHSYGAEFETPEPLDPEDWRACRDYLYGIDLFNHGFYGQTHEAREGLWMACGRRGPTATYTGAHQPCRRRTESAIGECSRHAGERKEGGSPVRVRCESRRVRRDALHGARFRALADFATAIAKSPQTIDTAAGDKNLPAFDLLLRPD